MYILNLRYAQIVAAVVALLIYSSSVTASGLMTYLEDHPSAPEFILQDVYGKQHALSDYRGRVLVVNFWATWCGPCREEMPSMQRAADWLAKHDIPLIGIGVGETRNQVMAFLQDYPLRFPLLLDTNNVAMKHWAAQTIPTTYVVNAQGQVIYLAIGMRKWDSQEILQRILALRKTK